jgi:hypothetical protein
LQNIFCSSKSGYTHGCAYFTIDIALGGGGGREIDICNLPIITAFLNDLWCHPVWSTNELKDMNMKHQVMEIRMGANTKLYFGEKDTMVFSLENDSSDYVY